MRKLTVILVIVLLCLQVFSGTVVYGASGVVVVDTTNFVPRLSTVEGSVPTIIAGTEETVTYQVKNSSTFDAKVVKMNLKLADESKAPIVLENLDLRQTVDLVKANETKSVAFNIKILKTAPEGIYAVKVNYEYQNIFNDTFETSETVYIRIKNDITGPKVAVNNIAVKQGTDNTSVIELELSIKNIGDLPAKDVKVTLRGLKSGGLTAYNSTDVRYITKISGDSIGIISYQLLVPAKPAEGSNELSVRMDYRDETGNSYTEENQIFVPVKESEVVTEETKPSITIENISAPQDTMSINQEFAVSLDLKNNGGTEAKNVKVFLATDKEIIVKSLSPLFFDKLNASSGTSVTFKMLVNEEAVTRNYPLAINIEYEDKSGQKYNASQYIGVYVENSSDNTGKTVPRIIVDKYSLEPSSVKAGEDFKLKMSFLNTSRTANVTNIKVTVASDDGTFTPTDSGNTFFIEDIPLKTNVERELMLHVKPDAEQKSYMLSVNFEYEDEKGNPYTTKETISVRVLQNPRLVTGELSLPPEAYVGQPLSLYLDFYNMGKSTLYNMMIKAVGDFKGQNLNYYVGNFEPGRTDYFDVSVIPSTAGELKGNIVFSFEDANGVVTEIHKEFTVNVMEMMKEGPMVDENGIPIEKGGIGMPGKIPGNMPANKFGIYIYIIPAVVVAALVVTFIILRKRHIRRKEMTLDE